MGGLHLHNLKGRKRFMIAVALFIVLLLGYVVYNLQQEMTSQARYAHVEMVRQAERIERTTNRFFERHLLLVRGLQMTPAFKLKREAELNNYLKDLNQLLPEAVNFAVVDAGGIFRYSGKPFDQAKPPNIKHTLFFKKVQEGAEHYIFDPHIGPVSGDMVTGISVRLQDDQGKFQGLVGVSVRFNALVDLWQDTLDQVQHHLLVLDQNNRVVLARNFEGPALTGRSIEEYNWGARFLTNPKATRLRIQDQDFQLHVQPISTSAWKILALTPTSISWAEYTRKHPDALLVLSFFSLMALLVTVFMLRDQHLVTNLVNQELHLRNLLETLPYGVQECDREGKVLYANDLHDQILQVHDSYPRYFWDCLAPGDPELKSQFAHWLANQPPPTPYRGSVRSPQGELRHFRADWNYKKDTKGTVLGLITLITDVTKDIEAEEQLFLAKKIFDNTREAILITNGENKILQVNPAFEQITGFSLEECQGLDPNFARSGKHDDHFYAQMWEHLNHMGWWTGEIWDKRKNGELFPKWLTINVLKDDLGKVTHYIAIFSDVSKSKAVEKQIQKLAYYDILTELPNRTLFQKQLEQVVKLSKRENSILAVCVLDLDRIKNINDSLGHFIGDQLIIEVSIRLQQCIRESDSLARWGGDEFLMIFPQIKHLEDIAHLAEKILSTLADVIFVGRHEIYVSASMGIALYPNDGTSAEELIKNADAAMYQAKSAGRNNYQFYKAEINQKAAHRLQLERDLYKALEQNEFVLYYQPKVDSNTGQILGAECLVRWQHPVRGLVPPLEFIPLAEESGMIIKIGEWIIRQACTQAREWEKQGMGRLRIAVNLSAPQFYQKRLLSLLDQVLASTGLSPDLLELEITESMVMQDINYVIATLEKIRDRGIIVSVDDFGTGYSSLSYLKRFPIHYLKIDQSFVRDLTVDSSDAAIVSAIISMAGSLNLGVVAEGVETAEQMDFLQTRGCNQVQGYFFSRPLPAEAMTKLLQQAEPFFQQLQRPQLP